MLRLELIRTCFLLITFTALSFCQEKDRSDIYLNTLPLYPEKIDELPDIPSPFTTEKGVEKVICHTIDDKYVLFPVTVENGDSMNYKNRLYGKGRQLYVNASDFPTLASTGYHSELELDQAKSITGKSISEISEIARPMQYSRAGFISQDEDIISVLKGDNQIAKDLALTHPEIAKPLFHVWNIVLEGIKNGIWLFEAMEIDYILYNGEKVNVTWQGGRGWQESIFNDEILGQYHLEIWRELDQDHRSFLEKNYPNLNEEEMAVFIKKLSHIHTGEMVPYYIMRYGFYEGHTDFRADPIAIAFIFGLRSIEEIENSFKGKLYQVLTKDFLR